MVSPIPSKRKLRSAQTARTRDRKVLRAQSLGEFTLPTIPGGYKESGMSTIRANEGIVTQINLFHCEPENQDQLVDVLIQSAKSVCHLPGWLSANIHRSLDGTRVINYAQSTNHHTAQNVIETLRDGGFLERNKQFGQAHPGLYEVVFTLSR